MTKRKRSFALGIRRKKGRNTKKVPGNVNLITYNNNIIDTLSTKDDSSNSDIILLDSTSNTNDFNNVITDKDAGTDVEGDDPTPLEDLEMEGKNYCQMKVEAHRWTVFNFFVHRYSP